MGHGNIYIVTRDMQTPFNHAETTAHESYRGVPTDLLRIVPKPSSDFVQSCCQTGDERLVAESASLLQTSSLQKVATVPGAKTGEEAASALSHTV